jgi:gamma-glutamylcyclotransferase
MSSMKNANSDSENGFVFDSKADKLFYFAYGSNMNKKQITERCTAPKAIGIACLADSKLEFFGHSAEWDGGQESVIPSKGENVWGVIYELSQTDKDRLDSLQDIRMDGTGAYFHYPARLIDQAGVGRAVLFYRRNFCDVPQKPSREYLEFIIQGAVENGLPAEYIEKLRRIESKEAAYPVPRRKKLGSELPLLNSDCSDCSHS